MRILKYIVLALMGIFGVANASATQISVIPYPSQVQVHKGNYDASAGYNINCMDASLAGEAAFLKEKLAERGINATITNGSKTANGINLAINGKVDGDEAYKLDIQKKKIVIDGATPAGVFYGVQTLLQLIDNNGMQRMTVRDNPRYAWRGYMRDDARHFTGVESTKQLLDLMAYFKMNRFHWHLTDSQGWRIEIKKYPLLATVGGQGSHSDPDAPVTYYTQDQIRDIVDYASKRHIEIIPEIDMPGHATAANRAYPEYNGGGSEMFPDFTFNPGKESTYTFLTDVLSEIAALFPSPYMHIGGDEVAYGIEAWEKDPDVQALMKREGFTQVKQAERYFMNRMIGEVGHLGKTLAGWDELIDLGVDKSTMIMWWRHNLPEYLTRSLNEGYTTVLCPRKPLYFDFVQHESHKVGRIWDGFCPLEDVYAFPDPWFESIGVTPEMQKCVIGMQANAWSELLQNSNRVDFMTWPRLCAIAESAWTPAASKDFAGFETRLDNAYRLFDKMGIYYFDHRDPAHHPEPEGPVIKKRVRQSETNYRD